MIIYNSYTDSDSYYEFIGENGNKAVMPKSAVILVNDHSGWISIKLLATRKVVGVLKAS